MKINILWGVIGVFSLTHCQDKTPVENTLVLEKHTTLFQSWKHPHQAPAPISQSAQAVVKIKTATGCGTASFIKFGTNQVRLATNSHVLGTSNCLKEGCPVTLIYNYLPRTTKTEVSVYAQPVGIDLQADVSLFHIFEKGSTTPFDPPHTLKLHPMDTGRALEGHTHHLVGYPGGGFQKWTSGTTLMAEANTFTSSVFAWHGHSGSPFFNSQGDVVGMVHTIHKDDGEALMPESNGTPANRIEALYRKSLENPAEALAPFASLNTPASDLTDPYLLLPFQAAHKAPPHDLPPLEGNGQDTPWMLTFFNILEPIATDPFSAKKAIALLELLSCNPRNTYDTNHQGIPNHWCPKTADLIVNGTDLYDRPLELVKKIWNGLPQPISPLHEHLLTLPLSNDLFWSPERKKYFQWLESLNTGDPLMTLSPSTHALLLDRLQVPLVWGVSVEDTIMAFLNKTWSKEDLEEVSRLIFFGDNSKFRTPWKTPFPTVAHALLDKWAHHPKRTIDHMIEIELYQLGWSFE